MKAIQKTVDRLSGIVLGLVFVVIITAEAMVETVGGILFMVLCLSICGILLRVIRALQDELNRQKKIARRLRNEQRPGQKREKDVA